jgi:hypothetical protein
MALASPASVAVVPTSGGPKHGGGRQEIVMEKRLLAELLLVVQNIGTVDDDGAFVRGEDCREWIADLHRFLMSCAALLA